MVGKKFSLKDIKLLADHYSRVSTPEALVLFQIIQSFYLLGKNPENRASSAILKKPAFSTPCRLTISPSMSIRVKQETFLAMSSNGYRTPMTKELLADLPKACNIK